MNPIEQLRVRLGLTQEGLARELDVSVSSIKRWLSGKPVGSDEMKLKLINEYGIDPRELLSISKSVPQPTAEAESR